MVQETAEAPMLAILANFSARKLQHTETTLASTRITERWKCLHSGVWWQITWQSDVDPIPNDSPLRLPLAVTLQPGDQAKRMYEETKAIFATNLTIEPECPSKSIRIDYCAEADWTTAGSNTQMHFRRATNTSYKYRESWRYQ